MLETGRVLNHYEIVRMLGKGGMGEVYVARDQRLGREVALKVLRDDLASNDERRERFEREARSVAALQHPNIVTLHSIEEADGITFLVMELIAGKPLSKLIPRNGLPLDRFLEIAIPLADAVAAAHARGITHRDLKPDNVLVDDQGRAQILDFGLAKMAAPTGLDAGSMGPTEALTGEGRIVGTIAYMSPEQVDAREVDARSDIFSLGVMFYEMATGVRPFDGDTSMSVLSSILRDEPKPVTEQNQRLPRYLGRIVKRCLQKDPSNRYQSALDLRNDLVELRDELASGELTGSGAAVPLSSRRSLRWLPVVSGLVILAALGLLWSTRPTARSSTETSQSGYEMRRLIVRGSPGTAAISPDGRYVVYTSEAAGGRSLRLQQVATGSDIELLPAVDWDVNLTNLGFTPQGEYVRYAQGAGGGRTLWEVPALGGPRRRLADEILIGPAFSPDGRHAAFVPGSEFLERWASLVVMSLDDGSRRTVFELPEGGADVESVAWSPEGDRLALEVFRDGQGDFIELLTLETESIDVVPGDPSIGIEELCWSADGRTLVVVARAVERGRLQLWSVDPRSGERTLLVRDFNSYEGCSTTADGRMTATVRRETFAQLWVVPLDDPRDARAVQTTTGRVDGADRIAWLDNDTIVYGAPDGESWNLWQVAAEGGVSTRLTAEGAFNVTAGGGRVAFSSGWATSGAVGIYGSEVGSSGQRRLSPDGRFANRPTLTPDGEWVFYELLGGERMQVVRSPWNGGEPQVVTDEQAHLVSFSPDGARLALHVRSDELDRWQTVILPVEPSDREPLRLDLHSESYSPWADEDSLFHARTTDGVTNIYRVNIHDLSEEQVTFFDDKEIFSFDVSPDRARLAVGRGEVVNDLLLIEGLLD
jgi:serine/threonine protein kinase/Tol biopolymer transport system component